MYNLKGFISIETLVSNIPGVISSVGELSTYSQTYSKDIGLYTSAANRSVALNVFSSKSSTVPGMAVPTEVVDLGLELSIWTHARASALTGVDTSELYLQALRDQFSVTCENFYCGEMVTASNGKWYPQWLSWKSKAFTSEDNQNTVWFSDAHFRDQYDEYEIVVVPPVPNASMDVFFQPYVNVIAMLNARSYVQTMQAIQIARDNDPETILTAGDYNYVNPANTSVLTSTNWSILIYGRYGNDADIIRTAITDHILAHSAHTFDEWKEILPDIFKTTEFLFYPRWENYAVEQMVLQAGIYSGVCNLKKELDYLKNVSTAYSDAHIDSYGCVMPFPYKSLSMSVIGGADNKDGKFQITQVYPDIINVSSTSLDYNRMSTQTKGFLDRLTQLILTAETMTQFTDLPVGYKKVSRDGLLYCSVSYMNIHFLVCSKLSSPTYNSFV